MLPQGQLQGLGALPALWAQVVLPPPRHTHVQCLVLLTAEAQEAMFPGAPLRATDACRPAAAAPALPGPGSNKALASSLTIRWQAGRARARMRLASLMRSRWALAPLRRPNPAAGVPRRPALLSLAPALQALTLSRVSPVQYTHGWGQQAGQSCRPTLTGRQRARRR